MPPKKKNGRGGGGGVGVFFFLRPRGEKVFFRDQPIRMNKNAPRTGSIVWSSIRRYKKYIRRRTCRHVHDGRQASGRWGNRVEIIESEHSSQAQALGLVRVLEKSTLVDVVGVACCTQRKR